MMQRSLAILETAVVYALIIAAATVVCGVCFLFYPVSFFFDRSTSEERKDKRLRERAQLVMLKTGRLV